MEKGSSSSSSANSSDSSLNCLKFGQKIYFEDVGVGAPAKSSGGSSLVSGGRPPPALPRKGRSGAAQGGQPPRCQVEGCKVDLSDAKAYYSRHKVCAAHSKTATVIVAGLEQRFCQQCSRFHQLSEFDQGKRSCRRRLAGHNERRRKPPPGSLLPRYGRLSSSVFDGNYITDHSRGSGGSSGGGFLMDFAAFSRRSEGNPLRVSAENPPSNLFLQGSSARGIGHSGSASGIGYSGSTIPSGEQCLMGVSGSSSCALSLLSNQQPQWGLRDQPPLSLGVNTFLNVEGAPLVHPAANNHLTGSSWGFKGSETGGSSHVMPPDLGLRQITQPSGNQYSSELELAEPSGRQYVELEHSRAYDSSSTQHMQWSL
ncbi:hypothetical protein NMG60_11001836 [Bertholletia excelsa]